MRVIVSFCNRQVLPVDFYLGGYCLGWENYGVVHVLGGFCGRTLYKVLWQLRSGLVWREDGFDFWPNQKFEDVMTFHWFGSRDGVSW